MSKDTIYRQDAIEALRMCQTYLFHTHDPDTKISLESAEYEIEQLPSAQPGFVRCIECKWYEGDIMANPWGVCCHPGWIDGNSGHEVSENGWCYRAERREE